MDKPALLNDVFSVVEKVPLKDKQERYAMTTCIDEDLFYVKGRGSKIRVRENDKWRWLIDTSAGVSTKNIGYGNPAVSKIIRQQLCQEKDITGYPHHDMQNEHALDLAWVLAELLPLKYEKEVVFANSGTEGIEAAIKLCYNARSKHSGVSRRRKDFIACYGAFHGRTLGSLTLACSKPAQREYYPTNAFPTYHVVFPAEHRYFVYDDDGDIQHIDYSPNEYVEEIKKACRRGKIDIDSVNAVVLELIQGEGGLNVASKRALQDLIGFLKENDVFVVIDEIQTGLGRTGKMFAFEHFNIEPDVVVLSKSLAYGWPFSAVIYRKDMRWTEKGRQSSTFAGSPMGSAIATEVLRTLVQENLSRRAEDLGDRILGPALRTMERDYSDVVHSVRGLGLMHGIEFWNSTTGKPAVQFRNDVVKEGRRRGVLFLDAGISTIRLTPPLVIGSGGEDKSPNELYMVIDILEESIKTTRRKSKRIV